MGDNDPVTIPTTRTYDEVADGKEVDVPTSEKHSLDFMYRGFRVAFDIHSRCKSHQLEAIQFMLDNLIANKGSLIAHSMGLGKTFSTLCVVSIYAERFKALRVVVAAPKIMVQPWIDELLHWDLPIASHTIKATEDTRRVLATWKRIGGILVIGHDQFRISAADLDICTDTVMIVDEGHFLKSPNTQLYQAVDSVLTKRRILLTGTPLQNHLDEYYWMVQLLAPNLLGASLSDFKRQFGNSIINGMLKDSTKAQIKRCERAVQMLRWRMEKVMHEKSASLLQKELPNKVEYRIQHHCSLPIAPDSNQIKERHAVHESARPDKMALGVALLDAIRSITNESVVIFSTRIETLNAMNRLRPGLVFTGEQSDLARYKMMCDFQSGTASLIYITTRSGGVGISLTAGSRIIMLDNSWNPVDDVQAVSRCWRMGQKRNVFVYRLIAHATLEERVYRLNVQKQGLAARVLSDQDINRLYTKEDLMNITNSYVEQSPADFSTDAVLLVALQQYKGAVVYDHNNLFLDQDVQLSTRDRDIALNEYNRFLSQQTRTAKTPDGDEQEVLPGQTHFDPPFQDTLVVPPAPWFSNLLNETVDVNCGAHKVYILQYTTCRDDDESTNWTNVRVVHDGNSIVSIHRPSQKGYFRICVGFASGKPLFSYRSAPLPPRPSHTATKQQLPMQLVPMQSYKKRKTTKLKGGD